MDKTRELLDAIISGNYSNANEMFKSAVNGKISDAMGELKREIAPAIVNPVSEEMEELDEVLSKDAEAEEFIRDFINSDDPRFKGKTKKQRIQMALGAYYAKQRGE